MIENLIGPIKCPKCGSQDLQVLLFMGIEPDGFVCPKCSILFDPETLKPLATVIGVSELASGDKELDL